MAGLVLLIFAAASPAPALGFEPAVPGEFDPVGGGKAILRLDGRFASNGIAVSGVWGATVDARQRTVETRIVGGAMEPLLGLGRVRARGGLALGRGRRSVKIAGLRVNTEKGVVWARIGGRKMALGSLVHPSHARWGFGVRVRAEEVELTGAAAARISRKLALRGRNRIGRRQALGGLELLVQPRRVTIVTGDAEFIPGGADTLAKLASKGVPAYAAFSAAFPASRRTMIEAPGFYFRFGVYYGGSVLRDGSAGTVGLAGGMEIKQPGGSAVLFANLRFRFQDGTMQADTYVDGVRVSRNTPIAAGLPMPVPVAKERAFRIELARVEMVEETAALLNRQFPGGAAFVAGDSLGTLTLLAVGQ